MPEVWEVLTPVLEGHGLGESLGVTLETSDRLVI